MFHADPYWRGGFVVLTAIGTRERRPVMAGRWSFDPQLIEQEREDVGVLVDPRLERCRSRGQSSNWCAAEWDDRRAARLAGARSSCASSSGRPGRRSRRSGSPGVSYASAIPARARTTVRAESAPPSAPATPPPPCRAAPARPRTRRHPPRSRRSRRHPGQVDSGDRVDESIRRAGPDIPDREVLGEVRTEPLKPGSARFQTAAASDKATGSGRSAQRNPRRVLPESR